MAAPQRLPTRTQQYSKRGVPKDADGVVAWLPAEFGNVQRAIPILTRVLGFGSAAPTSGTWQQGDIVLNDTPTAGGFIGWTCTASGMPGTWKTWGVISV